MASIHGTVAALGNGAYTAAKHGVVGIMARRPNWRAQWAPDEESGTRGALRGDPRAGPHRHTTVNRVLQTKNAATRSPHFTRISVHYFVGTWHPPLGHPKEFAGATAPQVSIKCEPQHSLCTRRGYPQSAYPVAGGIRAGG